MVSAQLRNALGTALVLMLASCGGGSSSTAAGSSEFSADADTVVLWHFNEGTGQTVADASGNGRDLTLANSIGVETPDPTWSAAGRFDAGLDYARADGDYCRGLGSNAFPTNTLSLELWYRTTSRGGVLFNAGSICCLLEWSSVHPNAGLTFGVGNGAAWTYMVEPDAPPNNLLADGGWHYIAATYDGSTMRLYVDGQETESQAAVVTLPSPTSTYFVGGRPTNTFIEGSIDEVRLSSSARSPAEILAHWTNAP